MFEIPRMRVAIAALCLFLLGLAGQLAGLDEWIWWTAYLACCVLGGWQPAREGLDALRERRLDVDLLMVLAAIGAVAIGQVMDAGLLIVIFASSGALEELATRRTQDSVRGLLRLAPETVTKLGEDGELRVPVAELVPGDQILVRPGERIGADGVVLAGASEVDQASITGEPLEAPKVPGDEVFAGTGNGTGRLRVEVTRAASDTVVARIAEAVRQAGETKARRQLFVETVEHRYSIGMVVVTLALFLLPLVFGEPLRESLERAMTFMIVASPCAVVLATMPPLLAAIATAGRNGVLVKSAPALERFARAGRLAFDKTGTVTTGEAVVVEAHAVTGTEEELLRLAASAEYPSEHPLGRAVVAAARARGIGIVEVDSFTAVPGWGVRARVEGARVEVGAAGDELAMDGVLASVRERGRTAVLVCREGTVLGVLGIADRIRDGAADAVRAAHGQTGVEPVLLTGDHAASAYSVGAELGFGEIRAGLLPEAKTEAVRGFAESGERLAMVGDGVNDASALAAADTGIAMGNAGADLSVSAADVVLVHDRLDGVASLLALARRAERLVRANLVIAAACMLVLVVWDLVGVLPLPLGVAGHEGSTVLVGLNGLRLLGDRVWRRARRDAGLAD